MLTRYYKAKENKKKTVYKYYTLIGKYVFR